MPSTSVTPLMVKVSSVFAGSGACGVIVAIVKALVPVLKLMLAGTTVWAPPLTVTLEAFTVIGSIGPLKLIRITAFTPAPVELSGGPTARIVGAAVTLAVPVVKYE